LGEQAQAQERPISNFRFKDQQQIKSDRLIILLVTIIFSAALLLSINFSYLVRTKSFIKAERDTLQKTFENAAETATNDIVDKIKADLETSSIVEKFRKNLEKLDLPLELRREIESGVLIHYQNELHKKLAEFINGWKKEPPQTLVDKFKEEAFESIVDEWKKNPPSNLIAAFTKISSFKSIVDEWKKNPPLAIKEAIKTNLRQEKGNETKLKND